jgi:uncharacterized protein YidB (DUF937 family)
MALLDEIVGGLLGGGQPVSRTQSSDLLSGVIEMLGSQQGGGLDGLTRSFAQHGLGDVVASWIGTGQNQPIAPDQLSRALGQGQIDALSQRSGLASSALPGVLAALLPVVIDKLTPQGRVTPQTDLLALGRGLFEDGERHGAARSAAASTPRPDFSDVDSGGSSTAAAPGAAAAKTYTVAAGDSLSRIAKKLYGNGNQWQKIFDANRDQLENPDLIHPGQILKIP